MTRIIRMKLYEKVILQLEEMVKIEKLQPGDRLQSERELAATFGVSRMAIREALSALQAAGFLEIRHGLGIFVRNPNETVTNNLKLRLLTEKERLLNILEFRKGLETLGAFLAAERADADELAQLKEIIRLMGREIKNGASAASEDFQFHCTILRATHNPDFGKVFDTVANEFHAGLFASHEYFRVNHGPRLNVLNEHRQICEAIRRRKPEKARDAMLNHLESIETKLKRVDFV